MSIEVAEQKIIPARLLAEMAQLTARQLEMVMEAAALPRLQKRKLVLPSRESELLGIINRGLSAAKSRRLRHL
jgi:hypothetical protein